MPRDDTQRPTGAVKDTADRPDGDAAAAEGDADRVVLSFRAPDGDGSDGWWTPDAEWFREGLTEPTYRRYLRRAHAGPVSPGDEWSEFVSCGCASPADVILRVERVDGGSAVGADTAFDVVPAESVGEGGPLDESH
ncbi:hypothetical protein [Halostella litorea]|uniref:hypothetical protein n=1 Tax=Halostella litorea TaxID=2528831 RepID=UPI0028733E34|nr:hypothetical protein [Halostella litorea]